MPTLTFAASKQMPIAENVQVSDTTMYHKGFQPAK